VRGNETCASGDASTGCNDGNVGRLKEGRAGWFDEVMRFYDRFLKDQAPCVSDPPIAVQTNDGKWRAEAQWPPADKNDFATSLRSGSYTDTAQSAATGDASDSSSNSGVWTVSKPLPYDVHLAGSGSVEVHVSTTLPNANLVVDVYDLDGNGTVAHHPPGAPRAQHRRVRAPPRPVVGGLEAGGGGTASACA